MVGMTWRGQPGSRFNLTIGVGAGARVLAFEPGRELLLQKLPPEFEALSEAVCQAFDVRQVQPGNAPPASSLQEGSR